MGGEEDCRENLESEREGLLDGTGGEMRWDGLMVGETITTRNVLIVLTRPRKHLEEESFWSIICSRSTVVKEERGIRRQVEQP